MSMRSGCARCTEFRSCATPNSPAGSSTGSPIAHRRRKTREEVEKGFWGKLVNVVMKRPVLYAAPILIMMILLIIPLGQLALGGISEKYLPPDNPVRMAQEDFDRTFPGYRTEKLTLVIENASPAADRRDQEQGIANQRLHRSRLERATGSARRERKHRREDQPRCDGVAERSRGPQRRRGEDRRAARDPNRRGA